MITGKATHVVTAPYPGVPEQLWPTLRLHPAVIEAAPVIEGRLVLMGRAQASLRLRGIDVFATARLLGGGSMPIAGSLEPLLRDRQAVVIARSMAARCGLAPGDRLAVAVDGRRELLTVLSWFDDAALGTGSDDLAIMDVAAAQELLRRVGFLSHIDLVLPAGGEPEIAALLGNGVRIERAAARGDNAENLLEAFRLNLFALSLLAVFVGAFLAFNAMQSAIVRRRALIGIARSLGATRGHVFAGFLAEALVLGAFGTAIGLLLGHLLARTLVSGVAATISSLYFDVRPGPVRAVPATLVKATLTGLGAAVLAALFPAREAAGTTPRAASLRSFVELEFGAQVPRLLWFGASSVLAAIVLLTAWRAPLWPPLVAALCACVALACAVPFAARTLLPLLDRVFRAGGRVLPALGARTLQRSLSRSGVAMAALTVALSMAVGVMVMIASFRATVMVWVDGHVRADIYLEPDRGGVARELASLPAEVVARLRADPDVAACDTLQRAPLMMHGCEVQVGGIDAKLLGERARFRFQSGDAARAWVRLAAGEAFVSGVFANLHGVRVGDTIELGTERVGVAAVFYDYSVNQGYVLTDHALFERIFAHHGASGASLYLRAGVDVEEKVAALRLRFAPTTRSPSARIAACARRCCACSIAPSRSPTCYRPSPWRSRCWAWRPRCSRSRPSGRARSPRCARSGCPQDGCSSCT
ncbi:MAG: FtsX-like permease family protein [Planctomycetota bacterium]